MDKGNKKKDKAKSDKRNLCQVHLVHQSPSKVIDKAPTKENYLKFQKKTTWCTNPYQAPMVSSQRR